MLVTPTKLSSRGRELGLLREGRIARASCARAELGGLSSAGCTAPSGALPTWGKRVSAGESPEELGGWMLATPTKLSSRGRGARPTAGGQTRKGILRTGGARGPVLCGLHCS